MTFYQQQLEKLREELFHKEYLTRQIIRSKAFMEQHYAKELSLDAIAREACLSKFHFLRLFKSHYGLTPHQYLRNVRIRHAKRLLHTDASLSDICFTVGYDSVTYFIGLFKTMTGLTPERYRKKAISKSEA